MTAAAPAVTVLIPSHNRLRYLKRALGSVYAQTFTDFEVVVVDDASTDGTGKWILKRKFPGLRFIRLGRNQGPAPARNRGLQKARGDLVAFLDSDDLWKPDYLRSMLPSFRDRRAVAVFSNIELIDPAGRVLRRPSKRSGPSGFHVMPTLSAAIVRRKALERIGRFDAGFKQIFEDVDLFTRLALRYGPKAFLLADRRLACYRSHAAQATKILNPILAGGRVQEPGMLQSFLDLSYLGRKHGRWLRAMGGDGRRFPAQTLAGGGWGIFEMALIRHARR
jgi:glycosyltransferase involved in cell wall biosynthesis